MTQGLAPEASARVLVVVEQDALTELIIRTLEHGAFIPQATSAEREATRLLDVWAPHLVVLDLALAGRCLLQRLRPDPCVGRSGRMPVLGLTQRGDLGTKLWAFDQGLDDILTVPFAPAELLARVLALTRRTYNAASPFTPVLQVGAVEINILSRRVRVGETVVHLTGVEQSLLYLLAANAGRLLTRDAILDALWGVDFVPDSNIVDRHIGNLRAKLEAGDCRRPFIATVQGQGYRFLG